jgi:hypothetical protein
MIFSSNILIVLMMKGEVGIHEEFFVAIDAAHLARAVERREVSLRPLVKTRAFGMTSAVSSNFTA